MARAEGSILSVADVLLETAATNDAALAGDFDEARFRNRLVVTMAYAAGFTGVALAAAHLGDVLGPAGSTPSPGLGAGWSGLLMSWIDAAANVF